MRLSLQELEDILDDDQDMADMYIGRREAAAEQSKAHRQASLASTFADDHSELGDIDEHDSGAPKVCTATTSDCPPTAGGASRPGSS